MTANCARACATESAGRSAPALEQASWKVLRAIWESLGIVELQALCMQLRTLVRDVEFSELEALQRQAVSDVWHVEVVHCLMHTFKPVGPVAVLELLVRCKNW